MLAIFYMFWISSALHLFSSGQVVQNNCNSNCCAYDLVSKRVNCDRCCGYSIHYTPHIAVAIFFHLFGCYWATQFFIAASSTVIAGSVASYYWARGEASVSFKHVDICKNFIFTSTNSSMHVTCINQDLSELGLFVTPKKRVTEIFLCSFLDFIFFPNAARDSISSCYFLYETTTALQSWFCGSWILDCVICRINSLYS